MYNIEEKIASKNGWFTPQESRQYYGKYSRSAVTVHWWGGGEGANMHDAIVNVLLNGAAAGTKSANYVVSDNKITMVVHPDNVSFASTSGNPVSVAIEFQPTLNDEGYKKGGWLIRQLELRYGVDMQLYPHNYWNSTQCPGTISLDRLAQEANKWASGAYNPAPAPSPGPTPPDPAPTPVPTVELKFATTKAATYAANKQPVNLYQVNKAAWGEIGVLKTFNKGDKIDIFGTVYNPALDREWYITKYAYDNKLPNGFSKADLDLFIAPTPAPAPAEEVQVEAVPLMTKYTLANAKLLNIKDMSIVKEFPLDTPMAITGKASWDGKEYFLTQYAVDNHTKQGFLVGDLKDAPTPALAPTPVVDEWVLNLQDKDDTQYWFKQEQALVDITTGKPATGNFAKTFKKDEPFVSSALTFSKNTEYRITDYSFKKGIFNGVPIDALTLTKPGEVDVPPVANNPTVDKNMVLLFLETIQKLISEFIAKIRK